MRREHEGRDQVDASTSQGNPQQLGERHGTDSPSQPSEGTNPADTLTSTFQNSYIYNLQYLSVVYTTHTLL